jgi:HAD superfamily hydrolase (TIGR01509 family)
MLPTPRALLLDFGGVIADAPENPGWSSVVVEAVTTTLAEAGVAPLPGEEILAALTADDHAGDLFWRSPAPRQRGHTAYWRDVVAARWPEPARAAVARHGHELSRRLMEAKYATGWHLRPGMARLLADAGSRGMPMAVVSNTLCGAVHRDFLDRVGVASHFAVQVYSDEEGVRKPNPAIARRAVDAVGIDPAKCWFVGDTLTRDVLVARRAGLGAAVLMRSPRVERPPYPDATPDVVVADPVELHALLSARW